MLAKFVLRSCCRTSPSSLEIVIKAFFIEKVISSLVVDGEWMDEQDHRKMERCGLTMNG